jgi:hypothetical protein
MRIRATKPEFWTSKTIAALPWDVRLVLKGLESYVDDNGVGKDDLALIASDVFPRDLVASPRDTLARLSEAITALADGGLIARYEWDGEDLLYIDRWNKLQRIDKPARGRYRRPDGTLEYSEEVNRDTYRSPRETVASPPEKCAPVTGEQGNRGTGEKNTSASADAEQEFATFWAAYPKKRDKGHAVKAYRSARKKAMAEEILDGLRRQIPEWAKGDPKFIPLAATWLNGERWEDEAEGTVHQLRTDDQGRTVLPPLPPRSPWGHQ